MDNFPKFQLSIFKGKEEQFVIRGNDWDQFVLDVEAVKTEYFNHTTITDQTTTETKEFTEYTCKTCEAKAELQEGIGKNGKPYKLLKCSKDYKHNAFI